MTATELRVCRCGHAEREHKWEAAECGHFLCPCNKYDPLTTTAASIEGVCECGDWQSLHVLGRGNCRLCRFGTPPPDGPDGCQRYREAWKEQRHV